MPDLARQNKVDAFLEEIEAVCSKYQFSLKAILSTSQDAIKPFLSVQDRIPPKTPPPVESQELKKVPEAPKAVEPPTPEAQPTTPDRTAS